MKSLKSLDGNDSPQKVSCTQQPTALDHPELRRFSVSLRRRLKGLLMISMHSTLDFAQLIDTLSNLPLEIKKYPSGLADIDTLCILNLKHTKLSTPSSKEALRILLRLQCSNCEMQGSMMANDPSCSCKFMTL